RWPRVPGLLLRAEKVAPPQSRRLNCLRQPHAGAPGEAAAGRFWRRIAKREFRLRQLSTKKPHHALRYCDRSRGSERQNGTAPEPAAAFPKTKDRLREIKKQRQ